MKYKFTNIDESQKEQLENIKSLLVHGTDSEDEFLSVEDALNMPNSGTVFKRAIEEIILAPTQPNLIATTLIRTTFITSPGRTISLRSLGAIDLIDFSVAEEGEYPEISAAAGGSSMIELRFAKYGCKFKISEELLEYSTWDLITYQIQQVVNAMMRFRDKKIFEMLFNRGVVIFDNITPNASLIGRTSGRDATGAGNGSMANEDLIDMYAQITLNGYTPKILLCNPLHWAMFAKDPVLRESGMLKGDLTQWLKSSMPQSSPYDTFGRIPGAGNTISQEQAAALSTDKPTIPSYNPISNLTVVTSPLVPFNIETKTGDVLMLDPDNSGILAISEPLNLFEWDEQRNDIKVIKFREKWALDVIDNGAAIAVAKNISFSSNEVFINPQVTLDNVTPIQRKDP